MKVYISVDMEGIGGVSHRHPTDPRDARYPVSVALMVGETNAAIEGALAGGATDVLVNDSHWSMHNLTPEDLNPSARVLQGQKVWSMVAGTSPAVGEEPFGVALFIGYHARAGHPTGTIAHTYSGRPVETRLQGRPTGEYGLNALALGAWGIPVGLVCGDEALAAEVGEWLPWAERVVVKTGGGSNAAASLHPSRARDLVRAAAGELRILDVGSPVTIEADYVEGLMADYAASFPGAERLGDRTARFSYPDGLSAYRAFVAGNRLAGLVDV